MTKINLESLVSPFESLLDDPLAYKAKRFKEAEGYYKEGMTLHVGKSGVWSGSFNGGRFIYSYEKIGYHSGSRWLLEGFLTLGGKVVFHGFKGIHGEVSL
jgi:hypothetical protein